MAFPCPISKTMDMLRRDALARDMWDLAVAYGWSQIRANEAEIGRQMTDLERYRSLKDDS